MPFDGLVLSVIKQELNKKLLGGRIERIYQPEAEEVIIVVRRAGKRERMLLSAHAYNARVNITKLIKKNPNQPPLFCMVLRKHLEGGCIEAFEQPGLERVLKISVSSTNELGERKQAELICEIMGRHSNIILINPEKQLIIDGIKRYTHAVSRHREVLPGKPYIPPPDQGKINPFKLALPEENTYTEDRQEAFYSRILSRPLDEKLPLALFNILEGLSPTTCREIVYRAGLPQDLVLDNCGEHELHVLWAALKNVVNHIRPTLVLDSNQEPLEFAAVDLTHLGDEIPFCRETTGNSRLNSGISCAENNFYREYGEMNAITDRFFTYKEQKNRLEQLKLNTKAVLSREIKRLKKKIKEQEKELKQAESADAYKNCGELILANLHRIEKGLTKVVLADFEEPNRKVTVKLDPRLDTVENAQLYFKKYNKAKNARAELQKQLSENRQELNYLKSVELSLSDATIQDELDEIRQELIQGGYLKNRQRTKTNQYNGKKGLQKQKKYGKTAPLAFKSSDGYTIFVGKNNRQNDYLTLKQAAPDDIWLHTKAIPGSHVIIRTASFDGKKQEVPETTLMEAAALAAYYSRARQSQNVPVDYTRKKFVTKPKGARPGMVTYRNHKTINANPDENLVSQLKLR